MMTKVLHIGSTLSSFTSTRDMGRESGFVYVYGLLYMTTTDTVSCNTFCVGIFTYSMGSDVNTGTR